MQLGTKTETDGLHWRRLRPISPDFWQNENLPGSVKSLDMAPWSGLDVLKLDTLFFCLRKKGKSRVENSIAVVGVTKALLIGNSSKYIGLETAYLDERLDLIPGLLSRNSEAEHSEQQEISRIFR